VADSDPLLGPRLKIEWAKQHIRNLAQQVEAFRQSQPYFAFEEVDAESGRRPLKARLIGEVPPVIALLFGDAVHNLRASLDLLCRKLAERSARVNDADGEEVGFPFCWTETAYLETKTQTKIERLGPDTRPFFDALKPYKRPDGNALLHLIHELDIMDKHRYMIESFQAPTGTHIGNLSFPGRVPNMAIGLPVITSDEEIVLIPDVTGANPNYNVQPVVDVVLRDVAPEFKMMLATLRKMTDLVQYVIWKAEGFFPYYAPTA
jgi:hypothetical protein